MVISIKFDNVGFAMTATNLAKVCCTLRVFFFAHFLVFVAFVIVLSSLVVLPRKACNS